VFAGNNTGSVWWCCSWCCRPVVLVLGVVLFVALGGVGFLLDQFLRQMPAYKRQIEQLTTQVEQLETQVTRLETAVDELHVENDRYTTLNQELNATVVELSTLNVQFQQLNGQLNQSNVELERLTTVLGNQTAEYASHNEDLRSLVGFLNTTGTELGQSVELLTSYLDDAVQFYQSSSLRALELDYRVLLRSWDCDFREFFLGDDFAVDATAVVGAVRYPAVRNYVQDRILNDLCLNVTDWEVFMARTIVVPGPVADVTTTQLVRGVQNYTTQALQFYFPHDDGNGTVSTTTLEWSDWSEAGYQCGNLPETFRWVSSSSQS
jgi:outer membrane murein-binding lipoprotein Lpp